MHTLVQGEDVCLHAQSCPTLCGPMDCSTTPPKVPLSMEFSGQEYWSGLPFPSSGDLPDPGIEPGSPALQADSLLSEPPGDDAVVFHGLCDTVNCKMHHYFM